MYTVTDLILSRHLLHLNFSARKPQLNSSCAEALFCTTAVTDVYCHGSECIKPLSDEQMIYKGVFSALRVADFNQRHRGRIILCGNAFKMVNGKSIYIILF